MKHLPQTALNRRQKFVQTQRCKNLHPDKAATVADESKQQRTLRITPAPQMQSNGSQMMISSARTSIQEAMTANYDND